MVFEYDFVSLDEAQRAQRRDLLDYYGLTAQLSAFAVLFSFQVYFTLCWLFRGRLRAEEESVPRSPHEKSFKGADGELIRRVRCFWRVACWWATEPVSPGWGTKGQWAIAVGWTAWLMFLCVHRTSNGKKSISLLYMEYLCFTQTANWLFRIDGALLPVDPSSCATMC